MKSNPKTEEKTADTAKESPRVSNSVMTSEIKTREYAIDAEGKRLGRVATEAATVLLGKDKPDFTRHIPASVKVRITNVSKLDIPEKKKNEIYQTYSGYPSGRKTETLVHLGERRGYAEVVRRTIEGMLPNNKLKRVVMNNLVITE